MPDNVTISSADFGGKVFVALANAQATLPATPPPVENLSGSNDGADILLEWDLPIAVISSIQVWHNDGGTTFKVETIAPNQTSWRHVAVPQGVEITYQVYLMGVNGYKSTAAQVAVTHPVTTVPATPADFLGTPGTYPSPNVLTWGAVPASKYKLERQEVDGSWRWLGPGGGSLLTTLTYSDSGALVGVTHTYRLSAVHNVSGLASAFATTTARRTTATVIPLPVTGLSGARGSGTIVLNFSLPSPDTATSRRIDKTIAGVTSTVTTIPLSQTSYTLTSAPTSEVTLSVVSVNGAEERSASVALNAIDVIAPATPAGFTATALSSSIRLDWTANVEPDLDAYSIRRSIDGGATFTLLATKNAADVTHTDSTAPVGSQVIYTIEAEDTSDNVSGRATATATINPPVTLPPAAPTGLKVIESSAGIIVDWNDQANVGFRIYASASASGPWTMLNPGALLTVSEYNDLAAPAGIRRYYQVYAVDGVGNQSTAATIDGMRTVQGSDANFILSAGTEYPLHVSVNTRSLSTPAGMTWEDCTFVINFGDPGSIGNQIIGHQANHVYDAPADNSARSAMIIITQYCAGQVRVFKQTVSCMPSTMGVIYANASTGNDSNNGSAGNPVRSINRAIALHNLGGKHRIELPADQTFDTAGFSITNGGLQIVTSGDGAPAVIRGTSEEDNVSIISIASQTLTDIDLSNVVLDSLFTLSIRRHDAGSPDRKRDGGTDAKGPPRGILVRGRRISLRQVTLLNLGDAVFCAAGGPNESQAALHLLIHVAAPLPNAVRRHTWWGEPRYCTILGYGVWRGSGYENMLRMTEGTGGIVGGVNVNALCQDLCINNVDIACVGLTYICRGVTTTCSNSKGTLNVRNVLNLSCWGCKFPRVSVGAGPIVAAPVALTPTVKSTNVRKVVMDACTFTYCKLAFRCQASSVKIRNCIFVCDDTEAVNVNTNKIVSTLPQADIPPDHIEFENCTFVVERNISAIVVTGQAGEGCAIRNALFVYPSGLTIDGGAGISVRVAASPLKNWVIEGCVFPAAIATKKTGYIDRVAQCGAYGTWESLLTLAQVSATGKPNNRSNITLTNYRPAAGSAATTIGVGLTLTSAQLDFDGGVSIAGRSGARAAL